MSIEHIPYIEKPDIGAAALMIANDGQAIRATNYWSSPLARGGYLYLTWNAGAGRLLIPDSQLAMLDEMRTATHGVVITRGVLSAGQRLSRRDVLDTPESLELLFDDGTDEPFYLSLSLHQTDRTLPARDERGEFPLTAWTREGQVASWRAKYRRGGVLPDLTPFEEA